MNNEHYLSLCLGCLPLEISYCYLNNKEKNQENSNTKCVRTFPSSLSQDVSLNTP